MLVMQRPKVEALGDAEGDRQLFAVGPLEPGFGHTLGNSLRRTLLSSIPGAAVTQVRFDEALHEFDTIKGVTEDVTDVILNLKDLVLRVHSDEAVTLRIDVKGPAEVTAGDIVTTSDVEILNPELHIATINESGRLAVDVTVEKGRGYVSAERNKSTNTIGVIPVDSIFSPVRRVTFSVEPTRVEQSTEFDRLVLDIETDGSITAREALASAGATLQSLVTLVAEMSDEPQGLELGEVSVTHAGSPDLDLLIEDLDLSERPRNCLKRAQVNTVGELLLKSEDDLLAVTNFGQKSLDEVIQKLDERSGLRISTSEVTAGDIVTTSDVEILNPELHIATINESGRLAVDVTVEKGRGYVSAERNKSTNTIGVIPVDSIFSPVRRVTFSVEPTRVEQSTEFDRLVLDIETDGSITAREALASAGATLQSLVTLVAEMSDEPQGLELGEVSVTHAGSPDLDLLIEDLDLSERPRNCLKRAQVNTVGELLLKSEDDLLAVTNFGQKSLDEVIQKLDERGLSLRNRD